MIKYYVKPKIILSISDVKDIDGFKDESVEYTELRVDMIGTDRIEESIRKIRDKFNRAKIIFTYRTENHGGKGRLKSDEYADFLTKSSYKFDYDILDIEIANKNIQELTNNLHSQGKKVIFSHHDYEKEFSKDKVLRLMNDFIFIGADIFKLALNLAKYSDIIEFMKSSIEIKEKILPKEAIFISMGDIGKITRLYGTDYTFSYLNGKTAKGQIDYYSMKKILEILYGKDD